MSHFLLAVLLPGPLERDAAEQALEPLLAPFDENLSVPAYQTDCFCVGWAARSAAREQLDAAQPRLARRRKHLRRRQQQLHEQARGADADQAALQRSARRLEQAWQRWHGDEQAAREQLERSHPLYGRPDPGCENCAGSGRYRSEANPQGRWDWWQVGGRWTGCWSEYDPCADPVNQECCRQCGGSGRRDDQVGRDLRAKDPNFACNGCQGSGSSVKWELAPHAGDIVPAAQLAAQPDGYPFALLLPGGRWVQRGQMGWFGSASGELEEKAWQAQVQALLQSFPDHVAVAVDCHT